MNEPLLQILHPEQVEVEVCRSEELDRRRGLTSELDEMWSHVRSKANPRWLWHAIDHHTGKVLAYVFGRRKDDVFLQLQELLAPFGITKFYTDGWGAYERHLNAEQHQVGKENTQKIEHIPPNLVVECVPTHRKPPEVRIWRLSNQSRVGTVPPSTSTPHRPAC